MMLKKIIILLLIASVLAACTNEFDEDEGYRMSLINYGFPVPKNAGELKPEACTGEITKSAKYKLRNIGGEAGEAPPQQYLDEIADWGWTYMEDHSSSNMRYFKKESKVIAVIFDKNVIDVFEMTMSN